jgi:hypothetical protein
MKNLSTISAIILSLFLLAGCGKNKQATDGIITVDVTAIYPKKELILQDFMDVEYIALETNDEFVCQGFVRAVGKDIIIVINRNNDGDIFIFDRHSGKGLKKINRKGQGGEEYINIGDIALDEDKGEMFVYDNFLSKILVYGMGGEFKRSLQLKEDVYYSYIYNFDRENLICGSLSGGLFVVISKQDGSITKEIKIPFEEKKSISVKRTDEAEGLTYTMYPFGVYPLIPYFDNWILLEYSSDTVYRYLPDHTMTPFIVRTPSIQSMNPEIFLFLSVLTDRYYFMEAVKKEYDWESGDGFPTTYMVYDKQEKALFERAVYNGDYSNEKEVYMSTSPVNDEIATCQSLEAYDLVEAYKEGHLKGRLKELAAELDEESNPVIMLVKHKK